MDRTILDRAHKRIVAAADFEIEVTLSGEEARELALWMRNEQYRNKCNRRHMPPLLPVGNPYD